MPYRSIQSRYHPSVPRISACECMRCHPPCHHGSVPAIDPSEESAYLPNSVPFTNAYRPVSTPLTTVRSTSEFFVRVHLGIFCPSPLGQWCLRSLRSLQSRPLGPSEPSVPSCPCHPVRILSEPYSLAMHSVPSFHSRRVPSCRCQSTHPSDCHAFRAWQSRCHPSGPPEPSVPSFGAIRRINHSHQCQTSGAILRQYHTSGDTLR